MPLPDDVPTFTLTAAFPPLSPGGVERSGRLTFTPVPPVLAEASGIYLGVENATLDASGNASIDLVANDAFDEPFVWRVDGSIAGQSPFSTNISVPASAGTVSLGAVAEFETLPTDYVVVVGPQGPEGPAGSGGGGGAPSGPAGGALTGSYPNPTLSAGTLALFDTAGAAASAQSAAISTAAADATTKATAAQSAATAAAATDATSKVAAHVSATDPHGDRAAASSALSTHVGASDPHGDRAAAATDAASKVTAHTGAVDPHGDRSFATSAVSTHTAAGDPHGDRAAAATDAASKVSTHTGAADPHGDRAFTTSAVTTHSGASDPHGDRAFATSGISTHAAASDPHGDRADAASKYLPLTGGALSGNLTVAGHALRAPQAADHGLRAWTFDPRFCGATAAVATGGTLFLSALFITESFTATTLYWGVSVAPTSQVAGQNFVGLYDSAGTLLTSVGVDSDTSSTGLKAATISVALTPGTYWVGFLFNATTAPQLPRAAGAGGTPTLINVGLTGAGQLYATNGTGRTSMPSSITMSSNVAGTGYWAAIK